MHIDGEKLKLARAEQGWSQELLAKASGLSLRTIQRMEKSNSASTESILSITAALSISPKELYPDDTTISANWNRRNIMQNFIALIIFLTAIGSLFVLAAPLLTFVSLHLILYTLAFLMSATILAFGMDGLVRSLSGLKYMFTQEVVGGAPAKYLSKIYGGQIRFCYGGAFLALAIGIASIHGSPQLYSTDRIHDGYAVLAIVFIYAALIAEVVLRPLQTKLATCDMSTE